MADSDHGTTMPFVTNGRDTASNRLPDEAPRFYCSEIGCGRSMFLRSFAVFNSV